MSRQQVSSPEEHIKDGRLLRGKALQCLGDAAGLTQAQEIREGFMEEEAFK